MQGWGGGSDWTITASLASSDPAHRTFIFSGLDAGVGRRGGHPAFLDSLCPLLSHLIPCLNFFHEQEQQSAVAPTSPLPMQRCRWWQEMGDELESKPQIHSLKERRWKKSKKKKRKKNKKNKKLMMKGCANVECPSGLESPQSVN